MKTPQETAAPDLHYWAAQNLQVSTKAAPAAVRAAFLGKLADCQWLPPPAVQESYEYLSRPPENKIFPSLSEQAIQEEEARLRAQIDDFAQKYFQMQPISRQTRYRALEAQCAWSVNLSARLRSLSAGLELNSRDWQDAPLAQQDLAQNVCQLFTLPLAERARRRWQMLQEMQTPREEWQGPGSDWRFAAQTLRENYPELAGLEPGLIDELAQHKPRREVGRGRIPQVANRQFVPSGGDQTKKSGGGTWPIWIGVVVVIGILRAIVGVGSSTSPPRQFNPPPVQQPNFQNQQIPQVDWQKFLEENRKKDNNGKVDPANPNAKVPPPGKADPNPQPMPDKNRNP